MRLKARKVWVRTCPAAPILHFQSGAYCQTSPQWTWLDSAASDYGIRLPERHRDAFEAEEPTSIFLISHIVQPSEISLPFKGRAGVGMGNFGVLVVSVRSHPPSKSPLEGGRVRSVRALACGLNLVLIMNGDDRLRHAAWS